MFVYERPEIPALEDDERVVFVPMIQCKEVATFVVKRIHADDKVAFTGETNVVVDRVVPGKRPLSIFLRCMLHDSIFGQWAKEARVISE